MSEMQTPTKTEDDDKENKETSIEWEEEEVDLSEVIMPIKREEFDEDEEEISESEVPLETFASTDSFPAKSRERYERLYQHFVEWCRQKSINDYTEDVLIEYFKELVAQNRRGLWALFSMLKCCILIHNNIDISQYPKLLDYLKSQSVHAQPKKSRALTEDQINLFIDQADDREFLLMKVALIIGVSGGLRRDELYGVVINDLEFKTDVILATIPEAKTNKRRQFLITNSKWVAIIKNYLEIRLKVSKNKNRFFLKYHKGRCVNSPIGINTIGKIPSKIAEYLDLDNPEEYTGHCFRKSSVNLPKNQTHLTNQLEIGENTDDNPLKRKIDVQAPTEEKCTADKKTKTDETQSKSTQIIIESNNAEETEKLLAGLFSRVENCKIIVNIYNNCNVNK